MNTSARKEKSPPLEIHDEVPEEFIVVHNKCFMTHGCELIKQVLKLEKIFEHPILPKPTIWEQSQHSG
jgi:hypothetical protein